MKKRERNYFAEKRMANIVRRGDEGLYAFSIRYLKAKRMVIISAEKKTESTSE